MDELNQWDFTTYECMCVCVCVKQSVAERTFYRYDPQDRDRIYTSAEVYASLWLLGEGYGMLCGGLNQQTNNKKNT